MTHPRTAGYAERPVELARPLAAATDRVGETTGLIRCCLRCRRQ
jgi:hypothetical protein